MSLFAKEIAALVEDVPHIIANLANISAYIYDQFDDLNWAGFYLMEDGKLVLGPFQGKVACVEIEVGKGVCGTAVATDATQVVADVHRFSGHIACDSASNSEIVVPIHKDGAVWGVLDIDSPSFGRFNEEDRVTFESVVEVIEKNVFRS